MAAKKKSVTKKAAPRSGSAAPGKGKKAAGEKSSPGDAGDPKNNGDKKAIRDEKAPSLMELLGLEIPVPATSAGATEPAEPTESPQTPPAAPAAPPAAATPKKRSTSPRSGKKFAPPPTPPAPPDETDSESGLEPAPTDELPLSPNLKIRRNPNAAARLTLLKKPGASTQPEPAAEEIASPVGEIAPAAEEIASPAGEIAPAAGEIVPAAEEIASTAGEIVPAAGEIASTAGEIASTAGGIASTAEEIASTAGEIAFTKTTAASTKTTAASTKTESESEFAPPVPESSKQVSPRSEPASETPQPAEAPPTPAPPSPPLPLSPSAAPPPRPAPAEEHLQISRRAAWLGIVAFLALLVLPPLIHDLRLLFSAPSQLPVARFVTALTGSERPSTPVAQRLRLFEQELARASFTEAPRTAMQRSMLSLLERGNPRVIPGADDGSGKRWLFLRAEVQALTGWGPLQEEPRGVASDPDTRTWQPPLPVILDFAAKLKERGVQLWLMPVPMKAALFPDKLTGQPASAPLRHPDEAELYRRLTDGGVRVLDLTDDFWQARSAADAGKIEPLYLRTDTHWSSQAVQLAASRAGLEIAAEAQRSGWAGLPESPGQLPEFVLAPPLPGDLVELLGAGPGGAEFETSPAIARCLTADGKPLRPVRESPVLVLGDSNVNIFDDPSLGFAPEGLPPVQRISAGFAQHLAAQLTSAMNIAGVDVHAINGKGTTGVREEFFRRGESAVRGKKIVLWVLAARNLLLNRRDAAAADVDWTIVDVSPDPAPAPSPPQGAPDAATAPPVVEAEVVDKSDLVAPESANYADALYTVRYRVKRTLSGPAPAADGAEIVAVHWNFKKRALQPARTVEAGKVYHLQLAPWPRPDLESLNLEDKFDDIVQRWWVETPEGL